MTELFLGLDTETTGFKRKGALIQDGQARVCQLAMVLADSNGKPLAKFSSLIKPDGWTISEGASKVNGLTDEICERTGLMQATVYCLYRKFASMADVIVAHNSAFDKGMMEIEGAYYREKLPAMTIQAAEIAYARPENDWYCTAKSNVDVCKIPPTPKMIAAGRNHYKTPNLEEALQFFCKKSVGKDAHDAMVDTEACLEVFFAARARAAA